MDSLLAGLNEITTFVLPKSSKTLLKTPSSVNSIVMSGGTYCHVGIDKCLMATCLSLSRDSQPIPEEFILDFNIDGVSYSKSTKSSLTLIQMNLRDIGFNPFVVGAYVGKVKPECNEFLKYFVHDINEIKSNGFQYGDNLIRVKVGNFCCDTPAVSFIRGSKGHAGFNCCVKCTQKGIRLDSRLVFPYITQGDRTDEDFRNRKDPEHHVKTSILENIEDLDMVSSFPIDEMHVVHLGVVKKLVQEWINVLTKKELEEIFVKVQAAEKYRPIEIRRQIRHLDEFKQYKAKEFRTLLIYTGPFLLKDILDNNKYKHFLLLHIAMRKLYDKKYHNDYESIQKMIEDFVRQFKQLYGLNRLTLVVHSLIHLCEDVKLYGPPRNFSAYKYENNNNKLTRNIRHGKNVAQQIHNRALEAMNLLSPASEMSSSPSLEGKFVDMVDKKTKFRRIRFNQLTIDRTLKNQWILTKNNEICCFKYAEISKDTILLTCEKICEPLESFYCSPLESVDLNIFFVKQFCDIVDGFKINVDMIYTKMYAMPVAEGMVFFPLINE